MEISTLQKSLQHSARTVKLRSQLSTCMDRREKGLVPPNAELYLFWTGKGKLTDRVLLLSLASWYMKPELRSYLQLSLLDFEIKKLQPEDQILAELVLSSKVAALEVLSRRMSERDWFGNFLPLYNELLETIHFQWRLPRKPKKKVFRRGYKDHGSLRPAERWTPRFSDSLTELQNSIEEERKSLRDTLEFLRGWLE